MTEICTTATFDELFLKLPKTIQAKTEEKTRLFRENHFNPILRTEKLHPRGHDVWSFRVDVHYRIVFKFTGKDTVEFRFVGHYNQIYDYNIFRE